LNGIRAEHGDLLVVTPGFDESDLDEVAKPSVIFVTPPVRPSGHRGTREECTADTEEAVKAALINFEPSGGL